MYIKAVGANQNVVRVKNQQKTVKKIENRIKNL